MEHGAIECIKEQSHREMTIAIGVQSPAYVNTEITATNTIKGPGLMEHVKSEPGLLVKEEVVEDSWQDIDELERVQEAAAIVGSTNVLASGADMSNVLDLKEELGAIDIGLIVLQDMDTPYRTNQHDVVKQENAIKNNDTNPTLYCGVKEETIENECRGSPASQEVVIMNPGTCRTLPSLQLKIHKERLQSICRVQLRRLDISLHVKSRKANEQQRCAADAQHGEETQPGQRAQPRLYRCDKCLKTFKRNNSLHAHCRRDHGTGPHKCTECNLKYKCMEYLARHIHSVHSKQQYECAGCKKTFKSKQGLHQHFLRCRQLRPADAQHSEETQPGQRAQPWLYRCDKCPKTFKRYNCLYMHGRRIHVTGSHECTECNLKFKCVEYLARHIGNVHSKKQYECAGCKKMFKSNDGLRRHVPRCGEPGSAGSPQQFTCSHCGKNFKTKWYCLRHEQSGKCTCPTASNTCAVASTSTLQHSVVMVKEEPADGELELGPVVFQHMDSNYRPYKQEPGLD